MMNGQSGKVRLAAAGLILSCCIGCDQATKELATQALRNSPPRSYLHGTIRLEYALNPGGFLSLGRNLPDRWRSWLFVGVNSALIVGVCGYLTVRRSLPFALFVALVCTVAGGSGNLIDRVANDGLVTDFINVGIGPLRTGIFNVADVAITFGGLAAAALVQRRTN
jgi:signal peptidase II